MGEIERERESVCVCVCVCVCTHACVCAFCVHMHSLRVHVYFSLCWIAVFYQLGHLLSSYEMNICCMVSKWIFCVFFVEVFYIFGLSPMNPWGVFLSLQWLTLFLFFSFFALHLTTCHCREWSHIQALFKDGWCQAVLIQSCIVSKYSGISLSHSIPFWH